MWASYMCVWAVCDVVLLVVDPDSSLKAGAEPTLSFRRKRLQTFLWIDCFHSFFLQNGEIGEGSFSNQNEHHINYHYSWVTLYWVNSQNLVAKSLLMLLLDTNHNSQYNGTRSKTWENIVTCLKMKTMTELYIFLLYLLVKFVYAQSAI